MLFGLRGMGFPGLSDVQGHPSAAFSWNICSTLLNNSRLSNMQGCVHALEQLGAEPGARLQQNRFPALPVLDSDLLNLKGSRRIVCATW